MSSFISFLLKTCLLFILWYTTILAFLQSHWQFFQDSFPSFSFFPHAKYLSDPGLSLLYLLLFIEQSASLILWSLISLNSFYVLITLKLITSDQDFPLNSRHRYPNSYSRSPFVWQWGISNLMSSNLWFLPSIPPLKLVLL